MTKRKAGPPKQDETIAVRVSPACRKAIEASCEAWNMRLSDWMRQAINGQLQTLKTGYEKVRS